MRWSKTLVATLREDPQEAEIQSHKLMLRGGMLRKLSGGLYSFLPLGLRALQKVERIVREEMDKAGALEVLMPALQPREIWETSHRYGIMGPVMFHLKDRQSRDMVLGPTHEEVITDLVAREINSYRQLPKTFYQIQTKFRDEIRPRFGLMRAKEFIMKDAYSFDRDLQAADLSYKAMYDAYVRIFERCGIRTKVVEADTGAMGGKWSHEFMVLADSGEDGIVECSACAYAANLEKAERAVPASKPFADSEKALEEIATPGKRTIEEVSAFLKCTPGQLIKTLIYIANGKPCAVLVPGDRDLNEHKLARLLETADIAMANEATIRDTTGGDVGFSGPAGLKIPIYADAALRGAKGAVIGANKADTHMLHCDLDRDAVITAYADLVIARAGDTCPRCSAALEEKRGIEVGHVFKLGTKYTEAFQATFLDENGDKFHLIMGCYGIGVTRTLQSIVEQNHDKDGIRWPFSVAPYMVLLTPLAPSAPACAEATERLEKELEALGIDVLVDDREERPGVKFKDADLIGIPLRVVISERSLASQSVEMKLRTDSNKGTLVPVDQAVARIQELIKAR